MKNILFLCTGNSCRSQMAEGWARHYFGQQFESFSAGTKTHGMNPRAVKVMLEAGVDISGHSSKTTTELGKNKMDVVFTVCSDANETCPVFPGGKIVHIPFDDPPRLTADMVDEEEILSVYREVRDEIEAFVKSIPESHTYCL